MVVSLYATHRHWHCPVFANETVQPNDITTSTFNCIALVLQRIKLTQKTTNTNHTMCAVQLSRAENFISESDEKVWVRMVSNKKRDELREIFFHIEWRRAVSVNDKIWNVPDKSWIYSGWGLFDMDISLGFFMLLFITIQSLEATFLFISLNFVLANTLKWITLNYRFGRFNLFYRIPWKKWAEWVFSLSLNEQTNTEMANSVNG